MEELEVKEWINVVLMAIATIIYGIVTYIQKSQIDKLKSVNESLKSVNDSMSTYASIFDAVKIKDYVEILEKRAKMKAEDFVSDNETVRSLSNEAIEKHVDELDSIYFAERGKEYTELLQLALNIAFQNRNNEVNLNMILDAIPSSREEILRLLEQ